MKWINAQAFARLKETWLRNIFSTAFLLPGGVFRLAQVCMRPNGFGD